MWSIKKIKGLKEILWAECKNKIEFEDMDSERDENEGKCYMDNISNDELSNQSQELIKKIILENADSRFLTKYGIKFEFSVQIVNYIMKKDELHCFIQEHEDECHQTLILYIEKDNCREEFYIENEKVETAPLWQDNEKVLIFGGAKFTKHGLNHHGDIVKIDPKKEAHRTILNIFISFREKETESFYS